MSPSLPVSRRRVVGLGLRAATLGVCSAAAGCPMFPVDVTDWGDAGGTVRESQLPPGREAVQVEVVFVERAVDDPQMGDRLWRDLDQVGAVDATMRTQLERHGFRVGHCGANPPQLLQKLLGLTTQVVETGPGAEPNLLSGQRIGLPAGDDYEIQVSRPYETCEIGLDPDDPARVRSFSNARCVLRLSAQRMQAGWVRLRFQPEIHHGAHRMRRVVREGGWQLRPSQDVVPVYALRFDVELAVREMAVVALEPAPPNSLGHHFFVGAEADAPLQRLLVVRVAGVSRSEFVPGE